jgi:hypothetical protein
MSHNISHINTTTANRQGAIALALNGLANVSAGSPSADQVLKFVSSSWIPAAPPGAEFTSGGYAAGWSEFNASSGSSYTTTGSLDSYRTHTAANWSEANADTSRIEFGGVNITRGTHGGATPTQVRFSKITLDAGKYLLWATTRSPIGSSASYIEWQWLNTSTDAALGPRWRQYGSTADDVGYGIGYIEVSTTATCDVRVMARTGGTDQARAYNDILAAMQIG